MTKIHPKYVVDAKSNRTAVLLQIAEWDSIIEELEELDDIRAYDKATSQSQEVLPFEKAVADIKRSEKE